MLPYFILGIALLAGVLLAGRWFASADPKTIIKVIKWLLFGVIGAVILFFILTGRIAWALYAFPALIPWFLRARTASRMYKTFSRMRGQAAGGATGQTSDVETRFLRMALDHDTGAMDGEVREGEFAGRALESMTITELVRLLRVCWVEDRDSAQVLEAYLDRRDPEWRERAGAEAGGAGESGAGSGGRPGAAMSRAEALDILGLEEGATKQEIREAHHRLIQGLHPDRGGSTYLAAQINRAKDVLLGR